MSTVIEMKPTERRLISNRAGMLIRKAAIAMSKRNSDGSVNEDRVNVMIEKLLAAAEIILTE